MIFTPEHVRGIVEGRKTQTRRLVKKPDHLLAIGETGKFHEFLDDADKWAPPTIERAPYEYPGDGVYITTYTHGGWLNGSVCVEPEWTHRALYIIDHTYAVQPGRGKPGAVWREDHNGNVMWALPNSEDVATFDDWTPLRIRITEIRREKLMNISHADAQAEGYEGIYISDALPYADYTNFMDGWNAINKRKGTRWQDNPLVWVLDFEVVR